MAGGREQQWGQQRGLCQEQEQQLADAEQQVRDVEASNVLLQKAIQELQAERARLADEHGHHLRAEKEREEARERESREMQAVMLEMKKELDTMAQELAQAADKQRELEGERDKAQQQAREAKLLADKAAQQHAESEREVGALQAHLRDTQQQLQRSPLPRVRVCVLLGIEVGHGTRAFLWDGIRAERNTAFLLEVA